MKNISLYKASKIYDEVKHHKKLGYYVCICIHDNEIKVGYSNQYGVSSFIKNDEPRMTIMDEDKLEKILDEYYKKDAVKIILEYVNEAINDKDAMECLKKIEKWYKIGLR